MKIGYVLIAFFLYAINVNAQESNVNYEEVENKVEVFIKNLEKNDRRNILKLLEYSSIKEKEHKTELKIIIQNIGLHENGKLTYSLEILGSLNNGIEYVRANCVLIYDNNEVGNLYLEYVLKSKENIFLENFYFTSKEDSDSIIDAIMNGK